jgi:hypothetical protein
MLFVYLQDMLSWVEVKYEGQVRNATGSAEECTRESREAYFRPFRRTLGLKGAWHEMYGGIREVKWESGRLETVKYVQKMPLCLWNMCRGLIFQQVLELSTNEIKQFSRK